ncbi:MAG: hypothetical protein ACE5H1_08770 [Thermodesulfobacteriota bacterium]
MTNWELYLTEFPQTTFWLQLIALFLSAIFGLLIGAFLFGCGKGSSHKPILTCKEYMTQNYQRSYGEFPDEQMQEKIDHLCEDSKRP